MAGGARLRENDAQDGVSSWQSETLGDNGGTLLGEEGMANEGNDNDAAASRSAATVAAGASNDNADDDQVTAQQLLCPFTPPYRSFGLSAKRKNHVAIRLTS